MRAVSTLLLVACAGLAGAEQARSVGGAAKAMANLAAFSSLPHLSVLLHIALCRAEPGRRQRAKALRPSRFDA